MRRREFLAGLGGAAAWPLAARAQQADQVKRVGVLMGLTEDDPGAQAPVTAFRQALDGLGWIEGRNIRLDIRWSGGEMERLRALATELVERAPDIPVPRPGFENKVFYVWFDAPIAYIAAENVEMEGIER